MHAMRRRPLVACVLVSFLSLAALATPSHAAAVAVSDEDGLRAAVANSSVSEVNVTEDVLLTAGHLTVPPNRTLTLRGACGPTDASPCTLDASFLSRHLHVTPGAQVHVSNMRLVNGSAESQACSPFTQGFDLGTFQPNANFVAGRAAGCVPAYFGYGVALGALFNFPGLAKLLKGPKMGDTVSPRSLYTLSPTARNSRKSGAWPPSLLRRESPTWLSL